MEAFKEMDDEALSLILDVLNEWWATESIPQEMLQSRIVLIFKKGDTSDLGNYRPISLLNSMYKMFTAIIQQRIANQIDAHLQKTQYGFRKIKQSHMLFIS